MARGLGSSGFNPSTRTRSLGCLAPFSSGNRKASTAPGTAAEGRQGSRTISSHRVDPKAISVAFQFKNRRARTHGRPCSDSHRIFHQVLDRPAAARVTPGTGERILRLLSHGNSLLVSASDLAGQQGKLDVTGPGSASSKTESFATSKRRLTSSFSIAKVPSGLCEPKTKETTIISSCWVQRFSCPTPLSLRCARMVN